MITKDYLLKNGFEKDKCSPSSVEDWFRKEKSGGYIAIRFKEDKAVGLYAYLEGQISTRKVVLNDTDVTEEDFEMAKKLCRF